MYFTEVLICWQVFLTPSCVPATVLSAGDSTESTPDQGSAFVEIPFEQGDDTGEWSQEIELHEAVKTL